ncbi:aldolase/citrate lyase family protein [Dactylosporangium sp. CA-139066]|uniref:aldolase/citrate lyase family protein n=1 Tax=Dactylosporangium sp. CA-139066 TaxID=3239930 RepID=UPI003D925C32
MRRYLYVPGQRPLVIDDVAIGEPDGWLWLPPGGAGLRAVRPAMRPDLAGVCASAAESAPELAALAAALAEAEDACGMPVGRVKVMPVVETAAGVLAAAELARAPRVVRLLLGEAGLRAQLRLSPGPDERELLWLRSMVVAASAAAGIAAPVADGCPDADRFEASGAALARLGFAGRLCAGAGELERTEGIFAAG